MTCYRAGSLQLENDEHACTYRLLFSCIYFNFQFVIYITDEQLQCFLETTVWKRGLLTRQQQPQPPLGLYPRV